MWALIHLFPKNLTAQKASAQKAKKSCSKMIVWPKVQGGEGGSTQAPSLLPHLNLSVARVTSPSPILQKIWTKIQMTNHAIVKLNILVMSPEIISSLSTRIFLKSPSFKSLTVPLHVHCSLPT